MADGKTMADRKKFKVEAEVKARFEVRTYAPSFEDGLAQARKMNPRTFVTATQSWWPDEAVLVLKSVKQASR